MRVKSAIRFLLVSLCLTPFAGCKTDTTRQADYLVTPLPKLTAAVEALVRYPPDPAIPVPDERLLAEAIKDKPELQKTFAGYPIKVRRNDRNVVILVCSKDGKHALLEDASWTLGVDHKWYLSEPNHPVEFTMDPTTKEKQ